MDKAGIIGKKEVPRGFHGAAALSKSTETYSKTLDELLLTKQMKLANIEPSKSI